MIDKCVHHEALVRELKMFAQQLGFDLVGITAVGEPATYRHYEAWLDAGFAAEMVYMVRTRDVRRNPQLLFMNAKSMIIVGMSYAGVDALLHQRTAVGEESKALCGRVARYACMRDYHDVLRNGLQRLLRWLRTEVPDINGRICVDSAPILERDFATRAGLGWVGKNTNVINRKLGSYFVIGELIVDVELPSDIASNQTYCGKCMQCIEACPTGALVAPFTLDARKCISYLTIEH
ncbi:MAG TPA: tRNA epoxyqueuosine(34) reductase QueG, partial [Armatimonadetes bacterium]|nr:tRNA epoxyqueuosine(34) reductase QueG [Armatimonadota bacterium]